jgi:hypothetical protein
VTKGVDFFLRNNLRKLFLKGRNEIEGRQFLDGLLGNGSNNLVS